MTSPILITGATGNTGQIVADELGCRGVPVVAMTRGGASRRALDERGIPSLFGDFDDPAVKLHKNTIGRRQPRPPD